MRGFFNIKNTILFEEQDLIVCHKPAGIAVQNARTGVMDMEHALKNYLAEKCPGQIPYLAVLHRLDQPVEGALVFAKTPQAARELSRQIAGGKVDKRYLAVTTELPVQIRKTMKEEPSEQPVYLEFPEQKLRDFLKKDNRTNITHVVPEGTAGAREARLTFRTVQALKDIRTKSGRRYLLEIHLETGRHHQIRVQMAHAGMPLLGDRKYNGGETTTLPLGLCSRSLTFVHPTSGKSLHFEVVPEGGAFEGFVFV